MIIYGALKKISEFERLGYPNAMIRFVCARLAMEMEEPLWFYIRKRITLNPPLAHNPTHPTHYTLAGSH